MLHRYDVQSNFEFQLHFSVSSKFSNTTQECGRQLWQLSVGHLLSIR